MQFVDRTVPANFNLFLFGDVHIGTLLHYEDGFDKFIDMLNSPYDGVKHNAAIGMGDYIEAIDHSDKRFDVHSVDLGKIRPDQQMGHFESKIKSFAKKIVLLKFGNHEGKLTKYYDYVNSACRKLSIPYGTYTAITTFSRRPKNGSKKEQYLFKSFTTHGNGSINSIADDPERLEANLNLSLKRKLKNKAGDCALMAMGHTHKLLVAGPKKKLYLTSGNGELEQHYTQSDQAAQYIHPDHRWYVNTGSFLRLYLDGVSGYAERAMYDPMEMGFAVARVRDCKIVGVDKVFV
jgi:hypothetical protein